MIQKVFNRFRSTKINLLPILEQISEIRKENSVINMSASPTGYSWLGVYNAGLSLFPKNTVAIPQFYSNQILNNDQCKQVGEFIGSLNFDQIVFNGYNSYFSHIIKNAKKVNSKIRVGLIHHGFFGEVDDSKVLNSIYNSIIEDIQLGFIDKIGFAKQGNAEIFEKLLNTKSFYLQYINDIQIHDKHNFNTIGVLTNSSFRKNTPTQVIAALSLKEFKVKIFNTDAYDMFDLNNRLIKMDHMNHADFKKVLGSNLINSHVTFSEASGGQVFTESLALGVPCLTSLTHGYLNDSEELKQALVVDRFDDAWAIAQKMEEVIANRDHLSKLGIVYSQEMNQKAEELLKRFLEA